MAKLNNGNYIGVQAFMVRDLHLKGNELLVYALIYGFTQAESQRFTGSLSYIAEWTSSTKQGVLKNIKSLMDKGLIAKNEAVFNGVRYCEYYATEFNTIKLSAPENPEGYSTLDSEGIKQSLPKIIDNKTIDNTKRDIWRPPTVEEVRAYCQEKNYNIDPERFIAFYASKGWKVGKTPMVDWKMAVVGWVKRDEDKKEKHFAAERTYDDDFFTNLENRDRR